MVDPPSDQEDAKLLEQAAGGQRHGLGPSGQTELREDVARIAHGSVGREGTGIAETDALWYDFKYRVDQIGGQASTAPQIQDLLKEEGGLRVQGARRAPKRVGTDSCLPRIRNAA